LGLWLVAVAGTRGDFFLVGGTSLLAQEFICFDAMQPYFQPKEVRMYWCDYIGMNS
jgi:hypothetical protein